MSTVYLGLGANLGDREGNIKKALELLGQQGQVERVSSLYDTEPEGYAHQPRFLNAVCRFSTTLSPEELLDFVQGIERELGRGTSFPNAPRPIDIDILLYDSLQINLPSLVIPHPWMAQRAFVLVPLAEIAPQAVHPGLGKTIDKLLSQVGQEGVRLWRG